MRPDGRNSSRQLDNQMQLHWDYLQRQCLLQKQQIMPSIFSQLNETYRLDYKPTAMQAAPAPSVGWIERAKGRKDTKGIQPCVEFGRLIPAAAAAAP